MKICSRIPQNAKNSENFVTFATFKTPKNAKSYKYVTFADFLVIFDIVLDIKNTSYHLDFFNIFIIKIILNCLIEIINLKIMVETLKKRQNIAFENLLKKTQNFQKP